MRLALVTTNLFLQPYQGSSSPIGNLTSWLRRDGQPPQTYLSWSTS
ncbi:hypothetical protein HMPREF9567_01819 [Cutibacterium acnes HL013PA1]|nr:hypothetical protein HMPREF9567_01819 [Cutibacterium acnes HL013PA1]